MGKVISLSRRLQTTWDGLPISPEPPYGCAIVIYQRTRTGFLYLVLHRKHNGPDYAGDWAWCPPSGARFPGEPVDVCAARELFEETGLRLPATPTDAGGPEWVAYCAEAPLGARIALSEEHDRLDWLPVQEAVAICLPRVVGEQILGVARRIGDPAATA